MCSQLRVLTTCATVKKPHAKMYWRRRNRASCTKVLPGCAAILSGMSNSANTMQNAAVESAQVHARMQMSCAIVRIYQYYSLTVSTVARDSSGPRLKSVNLCACARIQGALRKWSRVWNHVTGTYTANELGHTSSNSLRIAAHDKVKALNRACETQSRIPGKARVIHNAALKLVVHINTQLEQTVGKCASSTSCAVFLRACK